MPCLRGARAVQQVLIDEQPPLDIAIMIVWTDMLAGDNEIAATASAKIFPGKHVLQFHDSNRDLGKLVAESFGLSAAIMWDAYLFYDEGSEWTEEHMPTPLDWVHQLDDLWADPHHYAGGHDLVARLREITTRLAGN